MKINSSLFLPVSKIFKKKRTYFIPLFLTLLCLLCLFNSNNYIFTTDPDYSHKVDVYTEKDTDKLTDKEFIAYYNEWPPEPKVDWVRSAYGTSIIYIASLAIYLLCCQLWIWLYFIFNLLYPHRQTLMYIIPALVPISYWLFLSTDEFSSRDVFYSTATVVLILLTGSIYKKLEK